MDIKKTFIGGIKWTSFSSVLTSIIQIIKISILSRILDKSDFGLMAIVLIVMGFVRIFLDLGLNTAVIHKQNINNNEYTSLFWLNIFISFVLYIILIVISPFISSFYNESQLTVIIPIISINLVIASFGSLFSIIEQKELNFKFLGLVQILNSFISMITAIYFSLNGMGVYSLVWSMIIATIFTTLIYFINGIRKIKLKFHYSFIEIKPFLNIGLYQMGGQVINYFTREFDILIVGKIMGTEILGAYSLCKQLVMKPIMIINPILTKITGPLLAMLQNNKNKMKETYLNIVSLIAYINFPIYSLMILFSKQIILIIYGPEFLQFYFIVVFLSIVYAFRSIGNPVGGLIIATGRTDLEFKWNFALFFIYPLIVYFSALNGIKFLVVSLAVFRVLINYSGWFFLLRRLIDIKYFDYLSFILKPIITSILSGLICFFIFNLCSFLNNYLIIIIGSIIFTSIYFLMNFSFFKQNLLNLR